MDTTDRVPHTLIRGVHRLFTECKYSDLTVKCESREWHVHKNIVCTQSEFFAKACDGRFKEAGENVISLGEDDPDAVEALLQYLYKSDYDETALGDKLPAILLDVRVHAIADKYDVASLGNLAASKFADRAKQDWITTGFAQAIGEVYTSSADHKRELRGCLVFTAKQHATELFNEDYGAHFRDIAATVPCFGIELAGYLAKDANRPETRYVCDSSHCFGKDKVFSMWKADSRYDYVCPYCRSSYAGSHWADREEVALYNSTTHGWVTVPRYTEKVFRYITISSGAERGLPNTDDIANNPEMNDSTLVLRATTQLRDLGMIRETSEHRWAVVDACAAHDAVS